MKKSIFKRTVTFLIACLMLLLSACASSGEGGNENSAMENENTNKMTWLETDPELLKEYVTSHRVWQGIPGIEVTDNGRMFVTFYSGNTGEDIGNYCVLIMSDDGENFSEPIAVAVADESHRSYDPCLWIDPQGRLWFFWAQMPDHAVYAAVCEDPDADTLVWSEEKYIGHDVMMNKPIVTKDGDWLLPIAVWNYKLYAGSLSEHETTAEQRGSFVYKSSDNGETFEAIGFADVKARWFDEHMLLEHEDGSIQMFVRTVYGIGTATSTDGGVTWSAGEDTKYGGPNSRFSVTRLKSGRILLVNHYKYKGRNNLTAMLSEDEGKTWKYTLLLDERDNVSYPDVKEAADGFIYITYDRERGSFLNSFEEVYGQAREILYAKITEQDIINGSLVTEGSELKHVVNKLGTYYDESNSPYEKDAEVSE